MLQAALYSAPFLSWSKFEVPLQTPRLTKIVGTNSVGSSGGKTQCCEPVRTSLGLNKRGLRLQINSRGKVRNKGPSHAVLDRIRSSGLRNGRGLPVRSSDDDVVGELAEAEDDDADVDMNADEDEMDVVVGRLLEEEEDSWSETDTAKEWLKLVKTLGIPLTPTRMMLTKYGT